MIPGGATASGTAAYAAAHPAATGHYRKAGDWTVSSLGMGSYLGATDPAARAAYREAALTCLRSGVNLLDTAANYRDQASERDLGDALRTFVAAGGDRTGLVVVSKAGFLHGDVDAADPDAWFEKEYVASGILRPDLVRSSHSLAPGYVLHELGRTRANLGLETLDVHLLHNVEHPLEWGVPEAEFYDIVEDAFHALEGAVDQGHLQAYGVATWDGLRVPPTERGHLSLVKLVHHAGQARMRAGGKAGQHHFRAVELPVNAWMAEAALAPSQPFRFGARSTLDCTRELGMLVLASASLLQMRRAPAPEFLQAFGTSDPAHASLQLTRSVPGVTTALVGMGNPAHAAANCAFATKVAPAPGVAKTLLGTGSVHG